MIELTDSCTDGICITFPTHRQQTLLTCVFFPGSSHGVMCAFVQTGPNLIIHCVPPHSQESSASAGFLGPLPCPPYPTSPTQRTTSDTLHTSPAFAPFTTATASFHPAASFQQSVALDSALLQSLSERVSVLETDVSRAAVSAAAAAVVNGCAAASEIGRGAALAVAVGEVKQHLASIEGRLGGGEPRSNSARPFHVSSPLMPSSPSHHSTPSPGNVIVASDERLVRQVADLSERVAGLEAKAVEAAELIAAGGGVGGGREVEQAAGAAAPVAAGPTEAVTLTTVAGDLQLRMLVLENTAAEAEVRIWMTL